MKVICMLLTFSMVSISNIQAQGSISESAQEYVDAFVNSEFVKVASLTHADLVKMNGGEQFVIDDLKAERISSSAEGLLYNSAKVKQPLKIIQYNNELQAIIPVEYTMQLVDKEYINKTYLLAVSSDEGVTYKYVNLMQFDDVSLGEFISNLSPEIIIPADGGFVEK
jgi:hypothetical protein